VTFAVLVLRELLLQGPWPPRWELVRRPGPTAAVAGLVAALRLAMNRGPPFFVALNNPGAHAERWAVRVLTLHDYAARHLELLLNPSAPQCCDRSHHALPLVGTSSRHPPQGSVCTV